MKIARSGALMKMYAIDYNVFLRKADSQYSLLQ